MKVILNHDGAVDEFMSLALLLTTDIELLGVIVTPADCWGQQTCEASWKILQLFGRTDIPVALSRQNGPNPFPYEYRQSCLQINLMPVLNQHPENPPPQT